MKRFALAVVTLLFAAANGSKNGLSDEDNAKLRELFAKCVSASGVDTELIMKARHQEFSEDAKLKAYYFCMFKDLNFIDESGNFNMDAILAKLPMERKPEFEGIVKKCIGEAKGKTPEDLVYDANRCFVVDSKQVYTFE